ncbi:hypothetical protein PMIN01_04314 [Paraphaeosphaeria minitans]|uniref:Uncharacterized protein n=1 Tax=Paraphaeosphaeria minitans TaxID=565426 RepID=A0A9P6GLG9_9PLEO|nr:hypothetical protein PMIN01_04314 [Paraphaeosphaeria minitans]
MTHVHVEEASRSAKVPRGTKVPRLPTQPRVHHRFRASGVAANAGAGHGAWEPLTQGRSQRDKAGAQESGEGKGGADAPGCHCSALQLAHHHRRLISLCYKIPHPPAPSTCNKNNATSACYSFTLSIPAARSQEPQSWVSPANSPQQTKEALPLPVVDTRLQAKDKVHPEPILGSNSTKPTPVPHHR